MSNSQPSSAKFWIIVVLTVILGAAGLAALWPLALSAARAESGSLVREGDHARGSEAESDYLLATRLDASNHQAFARLAAAQISAGQPDAALASLSRAGEGSDVEQLKVRTLIELGRHADAASEATRLTQAGRSDDDVVLAALALACAGRNSDAVALAARVSSPEASGRVLRAGGSQITLASELYAAGLPKSSGAILTGLPTSYERNLLLARLRYTQNNHDSIAQATDLLSQAVALNPASIEARELLAKVFRAQGRSTEAAAQDTLVAKLTAGRP